MGKNCSILQTKGEGKLREGNDSADTFEQDRRLRSGTVFLVKIDKNGEGGAKAGQGRPGNR